MTERSRPTSWKRKDPFPTWFLIPALAVLLGVVTARRWTIPTLLLIAVIGQTLSVNWLAKNKPAGVYALIATWVTLGATWPWGYAPDLWHGVSWGIYVLLGLWAAWKVGRPISDKGKVKHREAVHRFAWEDYRDRIGAKGVELTKHDEHTNEKGDVIGHSFVVHNPPGNPIRPDQIAKDIDNVGRGGKGYPAGSTTFHKGEVEGDWVFKTNLRKPWTSKPPKPATTDDRFPLGYDQWGNVVTIGATLNALVAGETGSGKSNTINGVIDARLRQGYKVLLIDPKQVELEPWRSKAEGYADKGPEAVALLAGLKAEMDARNAHLKARHQKNWKGQRIACFIDEAAELFRMAPDARPICESLAALCRSAGIEMWFVTQYPTNESLPQIIKQNTPVVIGHRVKNGTANRALLGEDANKDGFDLARPLPQGMAVVDLPGEGRQWVQVYEAPDAPAPASTRPDAPWPMPAPPADAWPSSVRPSAPAQTPHTQGECPTDGRTDGQDLSGDLSTIEGQILGALNGHPVPAAEVAKTINRAKSTVDQALKRMEKQGLTRRPNGERGGWVRA